MRRPIKVRMQGSASNLWLFLIVLLLSAMTACSSGSSGGQESTTSATVAISIDSSSQAGKLSPFLGTIDDITSITVDVANGGVSVISDQQLTYSGGVWSGALQGLPIGPSLTFTGHAYNASAVEIFTGTTVQTMTGSGDAVSIIMTPVSNGTAQMYPRITRIVVPSQILTSNTVTVGISLEGNDGETLTYATAAANLGGSFSPSTGTIDLSGTAATLVLSYTAPSTAGTYTHSIRVTNSQANWVETGFSTVVSATANPSPTVQFAPVITALGAGRSGSRVTFTAEISDAGPLNELTYSWVFDGGLAFVNNAANPAVLQGYDETKSGTVTLTVANGAGGTTTVSSFLAPGLFPDTVVVIHSQKGGAIQGNNLDLSAVVSTLTGSPSQVGWADGTGAAARFYYPAGITTDGTNLYVADSSTSVIRKIVISTGEVTTLAGTSQVYGSDDGTGAAALFYTPYGITTDGANLYVADSGNHTIRKIVIATGAVTTLAGAAGSPGWADGTGAEARFDFPYGITTDGTNLYVADSTNRVIRKIVIATGAVTTLAGTAGSSGWSDGTGPMACFSVPAAVTSDGTYLYVVDSGNHTIRKIVISTGEVTTLAGTGGVSGSTDGTGAAALFNTPYGITMDGTNLYIADSGNFTVRKIVISTGAVTTLAGTAGVHGPVDGTGAAASFYSPWGITTDGIDLYVTDYLNSTIRKIK